MSVPTLFRKWEENGSGKVRYKGYMSAKIKMAVPTVKYTTKPEFLLGWVKIPNREHWLVRAPNGVFIGELFQLAPELEEKPRKYYALIYGRIYPSPSGCAESYSIGEMVDLITGFVLNRRT